MKVLYNMNVDTNFQFRFERIWWEIFEIILRSLVFGVIVEMSSDTSEGTIFSWGDKYEKQKSLSYAPFNLTGVAEKQQRYWRDLICDFSFLWAAKDP